MRPFFIISVIIFFIDRLLKLLIFKNFPLGSSFPIFKNILHITPVCNSGVAFGLFKEFNLYILVVASLAVSIIIVYMIFIKKPKSRLLILALFLILSGALGNLTDRLIYGYVLDFIDLRVWPVFNIADSAITIGAILMLVYMINTRPKT
ncbi:MAG: signal peptidase II [Candidatus Orphnella occulta]|nr:signal peptidase II [Candidatus Orphnella occulta]MDP8296584.1 signal peptidase II [Candidatus Orphnella occulta]